MVSGRSLEKSGKERISYNVHEDGRQDEDLPKHEGNTVSFMSHDSLSVVE